MLLDLKRANDEVDDLALPRTNKEVNHFLETLTYYLI